MKLHPPQIVGRVHNKWVAGVVAKVTDGPTLEEDKVNTVQIIVPGGYLTLRADEIEVEWSEGTPDGFGWQDGLLK